MKVKIICNDFEKDSWKISIEDVSNNEANFKELFLDICNYTKTHESYWSKNESTATILVNSNIAKRIIGYQQPALSFFTKPIIVVEVEDNNTNINFLLNFARLFSKYNLTDEQMRIVINNEYSESEIEDIFNVKQKNKSNTTNSDGEYKKKFIEQKKENERAVKKLVEIFGYMLPYFEFEGELNSLVNKLEEHKSNCELTNDDINENLNELEGDELAIARYISSDLNISKTTKIEYLKILLAKDLDKETALGFFMLNKHTPYKTFTSNLDLYLRMHRKNIETINSATSFTSLERNYLSEIMGYTDSQIEKLTTLLKADKLDFTKENFIQMSEKVGLNTTSIVEQMKHTFDDKIQSTSVEELAECYSDIPELLNEIDSLQKQLNTALEEKERISSNEYAQFKTEELLETLSDVVEELETKTSELDKFKSGVTLYVCKKVIRVYKDKTMQIGSKSTTKDLLVEYAQYSIINQTQLDNILENYICDFELSDVLEKREVTL